MKNTQKVTEHYSGYVVLYGFAMDNSIRADHVNLKQDLDDYIKKLKEYGAYIICAIKTKESITYS